VQKRFASAARYIHKAIAEIDKACQAAADDSDDELRCDAAVAELQEALCTVEWKPPADIDTALDEQGARS